MSSLWHPFTPMQAWQSEPQLSITHAQGNLLYDTEGRGYLDGVSSLWTNVHGHNHPVLNAAIEHQLSQVAHTTLLGLGNPKAEELAERLVAVTPAGLNHVFYSDSGSTAVEIALKQAFQYFQLIGKPEKTRFVHLDQAYHGDTLGAVAVGGIDVFHQVFGPLLIPTLSIPSPSAAATGKSAAEAKAASLAALARTLEDQATTIAALIVEPLVQGAGGILVHAEGFLAEAAALCKAHDVLLIVDEVATGFGRTGALFACEHEGVEPDLLCLAKGITGGYLPLAATLSTSRIYEAFLAPRHEGKTFFHGHTYTGNPLACAAALASLDLFESEQTIAAIQPKIAHLSEALGSLRSLPVVADIRQRGLMVGVELASASGAAFDPKDAIGHRVCIQAREHGVILRNLGEVIVLMPPLSMSRNELTTLVEALEASIRQLLL